MKPTESNEANPPAAGAPQPATDVPAAGLGRWAVVASVLVVVGLLFGFIPRWMHRKALVTDQNELGVLAVEVTNATAGNASASLILSAEVRPYQESPIYARASGFLKKWYVDIGAPIKAGELLADIDAPELEQQLTGAKAELVQVQAAEALARITAARWSELLKTSSVSEQENEEKQADLKLKIATVDASKANVHRLEDIQSFTHVLAPFTGTVTLRDTDVGDLINSGKELFRLADTSKLRVFVRVPQTATPGISVGTEAVMHVPELPARKFPAKVVRTAGAIDPVSRTLLTELEVENPRNEVLAGSYAQVTFSDLNEAPPIVLPSNTLLFRGDGIQVGVVGPDNKVELRTLTLGKDYGKTMQIVAGISTNDQVIINPPDSLTAGALVHLAKVFTEKPQ